jgi:amino acid transporter
MTAGALVSIFGTQSGVALTSPRVPYALAKEGTLPGFLGRVSGRFGTPVVAIWLTGVVVAVLAATGTFQQLLLLNVAARLYQYLLVCLAVAMLRRSLPDAELPFRLPLGPAIPLLAAALCLLLLAHQELPSLLAAAAALIFGVLLYLLARITGAKDRG